MNEKILNQFLAGLKQGASGTDMRTLRPWGPFQLDPYFFDLWAKRITEAIDKIKAKKIKISEIAKAFPSNAAIRDVLVYFIIGMKVLKIPKKDRVSRAMFLLQVLKQRSNSKDFSFLKENLILNKKQVNKIIKTEKLCRPTKKQKYQFGLLAAGLRSLMWSLYTDCYVNNGFEISGPYSLDGKKQLVVRDFFDLKPEALWQNCKIFPYKKITLFAIYDQANIEVKMFNRVFSASSLKDSLINFSVQGSKSIYFDKLNKKIEDYITRQEKEFDRLSFEEKKKIYIKIKHYALKDFFKLARLNWEPDSSFYERVSGKKLLKTQDMKLNPIEAAEIYKKTADPRSDFLPKL